VVGVTSSTVRPAGKGTRIGRLSTGLEGDRECLRRDDGIVPKWVVRGLQTVFVAAVGAAFCLTGMTAVFLATGFVNVAPNCAMGHLAHPSPLTLFGNDCVKPPAYLPWMIVFGVVGAALGLSFALGAIQLISRIRSKHWRTNLAA
jgi:hypothetical protein